MHKFNVWLDNKLIDSVFYSMNKTETIQSAIDSVKSSLINHDGYSSDIRVTWPKGQRLTTTVYELWGDYGQGYELLTADSSYKAIKENMRDYRENAPCPMKIKRIFERK